MRILRGIGLGVAALLALVLLLFVLVGLVNLRDERPSAQARVLTHVPTDPNAPQDNIYVALVGFDAPPRESPVTLGLERIRAHNAHPDSNSVASPAAPDPNALTFKGSLGLNEQAAPLWQEAPPRRELIARLAADNVELLARYHALWAMKDYVNTSIPTPSAPLAHVPRDLHVLFLADLVLRLQSADASVRAQALSALDDDVAFWRRVLTGQGTLFSAMIATAYLRRDEFVLADCMADRSCRVPEEADAQRMAPLFALSDWDIGQIYAYEFRSQHRLMEQLRDGQQDHVLMTGAAADGTKPGVWAHLYERIGDQLLQPDATENLFAAWNTRVMESCAVGAPAPQDTKWSFPGMLYNPIGQILVHMGEGPRQDYCRRAWDGAALQRLVRLAYEIRHQQLGFSDIPAFLRTHPELSTHPGDHRPYRWDPATGTLSLQAMGPLPAATRHFVVSVWRRPEGN